jgi:uncharacterized membrane protein YeaQ/YmgE (transglycosylase-associated protein family)
MSALPSAPLAMVTPMSINGRGQGFFTDIALGVVGAVVGGELFRLLGHTGVTGFDLWSLFVSVIGAVLALVAYHAVSGRRSRA